MNHQCSTGLKMALLSHSLKIGGLCLVMSCTALSWGSSVSAVNHDLAQVATTAMTISDHTIKLTDSRTGFLQDTQNAYPIRTVSKGLRENVVINDAADKKVIVYMHGMKSPTTQSSCNDVENPALPQALKPLIDHQTLLFYICSNAVDRNAEERYSGEYIFGRVKEFTEIVNALKAAGVPAQNIYLSGHSAGGWAALMTAAELGPDNIAGVIAFAPAFAGTRQVQQQFSRWKTVREAQQHTMISQQPIHALVFAWDDDAFEIPSSLKFLQDTFPTTVELKSSNCQKGHITTFNDCQSTQHEHQIRIFLNSFGKNNAVTHIAYSPLFNKE
ncbi:MAG: hypothetical protein LKF82_09540 [Acinetobacter populi]|uniref:alpha/beta hydrolase n=1 Tax=Acinetobacter populi TaxID=1582270 RepID=UPI002356AEC7|nr:hypothetical protein [Acinetobacter populi]MCH4248061.1 hypothetical protein [Acinetobacter populi]